jgi:hypothetical protein
MPPTLVVVLSKRGENDDVINRVQGLVLGFFAFAWIGLTVILAVDPHVYDRTLKLSGDDRRIGEAIFLLTLSVFLTLLGVGVVRRWRWLRSSQACCGCRPRFSRSPVSSRPLGQPGTRSSRHCSAYYSSPSDW